jgi:hypothetical protein
VPLSQRFIDKLMRWKGLSGLHSLRQAGEDVARVLIRARR